MTQRQRFQQTLRATVGDRSREFLLTKQGKLYSHTAQVVELHLVSDFVT